MLELSTFTTKEATLGAEPVTQLWSQGVRLINAIEYVNWEDSALQFEICSCGVVGCQRQGWVELKRSENLALITPAFTELEEASEDFDLWNKFLPPCYLHSEAIVINSENYANLRQLASFPEFETLKPLQAWEGVKLFQMEAPSHLLGLKVPKLDRDLILASSEGSFIEQSQELSELLRRLQHDDCRVSLRKIVELDYEISFYVELAGVPEWKALIYNGSRWLLRLQPNYVIQ